ncbi:Molecular chaperone GrpE (heat shock protein) [Thermoplasmatales archaeon BRNA1]|nr:Molecular chaperone GrpE (heat shock protein) [Thermoplasmatales archaeon BRNA1]
MTGKSKEESKTKADPKAADKAKSQIEETEAKLAAAQAKADEYLDMARRVQADFENFRRRTEKENADFRKYATVDLVRQLLNTVDDLGRALESAKDDDPLSAGVRAVRDNLVKILEAEGLREVPTDGRFDPNMHEALTVVEGPEDDMIAQVYQKGYMMHERVIRYAKVIVTKKKEPAEAPEKPEGPASEKTE